MSCPYHKHTSSGKLLVPDSEECIGGYYPQDCLDHNHLVNFCLYNDQNNYKECNFFPCASSNWHYCHNCNEAFYDTGRFCSSCGARQ